MDAGAAYVLVAMRYVPAVCQDSECPFCVLAGGRPSPRESSHLLRLIFGRYVQVSAGEVLAQSMMALLPGIDANDEHKAQSVFHFYVVAFSSLPVIEVSQQFRTLWCILLVAR